MSLWNSTSVCRSQSCGKSCGTGDRGHYLILDTTCHYVPRNIQIVQIYSRRDSRPSLPGFVRVLSLPSLPFSTCPRLTVFITVYDELRSLKTRKDKLSLLDIPCFCPSKCLQLLQLPALHLRKRLRQPTVVGCRLSQPRTFSLEGAYSFSIP